MYFWVVPTTIGAFSSSGKACDLLCLGLGREAHHDPQLPQSVLDSYPVHTFHVTQLSHHASPSPNNTSGNCLTTTDVISDKVPA
jgi:hypothetical protein